MENIKNYTLKIEKLDDDLHGVAFRAGKKYVVAGALAGETVEAGEIIISGNTVVCRLKKIILPSPDRAVAPCKYYEVCGGCNLMHISYENQLKTKKSLVKRKLSSFGDIYVDDTIGSFSEGARNKTHIAFSENGGRINAGFFNEDTHRVVDIPYCICHGEWYSLLRKALLVWIKKFGVTLYNPRTGKGALRFAAARYGNGALMLTLVINENKPLKYDALYDVLKKSFNAVSVFYNFNNKKTNEVLSDKIEWVVGDKFLNGECLGIKYSLTPSAFFQTNYQVAEVIYKKVLKEISVCKNKNIIDLFSGIGVTSALFAKNGMMVDSVEINDASIHSAQKLAVVNEVEQKIKIHKGDCKDILPSLTNKNAVFFVDPPRRGLTEEVVNSLISCSPQRIVYLSCNLRSLVFDLNLLTSAGYIISSVTPFDMFPHTTHVETLVSLVKKS